jgi:hypothetical protein
MHHGHGQFLPPDGVDLLAHDIFDLRQRPAREWEVTEDSCAKLADVTRSQEQLMADHFCIGWRFA